MKLQVTRWTVDESNETIKEVRAPLASRQDVNVRWADPASNKTLIDFPINKLYRWFQRSNPTVK